MKKRTSADGIRTVRRSEFWSELTVDFGEGRFVKAELIETDEPLDLRPAKPIRWNGFKNPTVGEIVASTERVLELYCAYARSVIKKAETKFGITKYGAHISELCRKKSLPDENGIEMAVDPKRRITVEGAVWKARWGGAHNILARADSVRRSIKMKHPHYCIRAAMELERSFLRLYLSQAESNAEMGRESSDSARARVKLRHDKTAQHRHQRDERWRNIAQGIRKTHPGWSEAEVARKTLKQHPAKISLRRLLDIIKTKSEVT